MSNFETVVNIFNPHGRYPNKSVICKDIAYVFYNGIPLLITPWQLGKHYRFDHGKKKEMLYGSFLFVRKSFPCFSFYPFPIATIHFKTYGDIQFHKVIENSKKSIDGSMDLPCLYNPNHNKKITNPKEYIKQIRSKDAYVNLFHSPQVPFLEFIEQLKSQYNISDRPINPKFVSTVYEKLYSSSRYIQIAIHYFVNASRLIFEHFIEDAGLNLNLVLEALIKDFMILKSISDKKIAIGILKNTIKLPCYHMEFIEELYLARNEFLAHIDDQMFTEMQNINDPDRYCYEHFESISWLLRRYLEFKEAEQGT